MNNSKQASELLLDKYETYDRLSKLIGGFLCT